MWLRWPCLILHPPEEKIFQRQVTKLGLSACAFTPPSKPMFVWLTIVGLPSGYWEGKRLKISPDLTPWRFTQNPFSGYCRIKFRFIYNPGRTCGVGQRLCIVWGSSFHISSVIYSRSTRTLDATLTSFSIVHVPREMLVIATAVSILRKKKRR